MSHYPPGGAFQRVEREKVDSSREIGTEFAHLATLNNNLTCGGLQGKNMGEFGWGLPIFQAAALGLYRQ